MKPFGIILIIFGAIGGLQAASWFFGYVDLESQGNPFAGGLLVLSLFAFAVVAGLIGGGIAMINSANKKTNEINWNALTDEQKLVKQQQILDRQEEQRKENERKLEEWNNKSHWGKYKPAYLFISLGLISPMILVVAIGVYAEMMV